MPGTATSNAAPLTGLREACGGSGDNERTSARWRGRYAAVAVRDALVTGTRRMVLLGYPGTDSVTAPGGSIEGQREARPQGRWGALEGTSAVSCWPIQEPSARRTLGPEGTRSDRTGGWRRRTGASNKWALDPDSGLNTGQQRSVHPPLSGFTRIGCIINLLQHHGG